MKRIGANTNPDKRLSVLAFILGLAVLMVPVLACTRYKDFPAANDATSGLQPPPFSRLADMTGSSPTSAFLPASIAAGTPLTVRLQGSLSSAYSHAGDSFQAVLEEPIVLLGETVVPQGTLLTGKVSAVSAGGRPGAPGYLRLTLTAISLNGKSMVLQTSSVFAKAGPREKPSPFRFGTSQQMLIVPANQQNVEFTPENRLMFRLAQPLWLGG